MGWVKEADDVIAIAAHRLMLFLRLALVASLAGYMLPTVSYAMHGDIAASYSAQDLQADEYAHSRDSTGVVHDHGEQTADHHKNSSNPGCCASFCLNLAVVGDAPQFYAVRASAALDYTNDLTVFAEPIGLNRPPAFRA